ncbi:MAG TPA: PfkB family carbohydrate kinase [Myxococcales bacterium]|jgi:ribokinase|nr:PfkB family carbohydrate kinase [Myxococcales bacterium]
MKIAVVGHVEHVALGRVAAVPRAGEIAHVQDQRLFPGGGGGIAFYQLTRSPAQVLLFTALGNDEAARQVEGWLAKSGASIHAARRHSPQTRDVVMISPDGERTIIVLGEPLHPLRSDALPWEELASCDAAYFTAQDPLALQAAREARVLIVTARRQEALRKSRVRADVVVGSASDPRESCALSDFEVPPAALVLTEGKRGGRIETAAGSERFEAAAVAGAAGGAYGAGDSFAGALVYFLAAGLPVAKACARASEYGAAVLGGLEPLSVQKVLP